MELATAIREGARRRPQYFGAMFGIIGQGEHKGELGSCSIGAAYEGLTGRALEPAYGCNEHMRALADMFRAWPALAVLQTDMYWRNDHNKESREQIADWVESVTVKA